MKLFAQKTSVAASRQSAAICKNEINAAVSRHAATRRFVAVSMLVAALTAVTHQCLAALTDVEIDQAFTAAATYQIGQPRDALARIAEAARDTRPGEPRRAQLEQKMIAFLQSGATLEAKRLICRQLWVIGSDASLPALEKLLLNPDTTAMACFALMNYPSTAADAALRRAIDKTLNRAWTGKSFAKDDEARQQLDDEASPIILGIIDTLGNRRDPTSVLRLSQLAKSESGRLAVAALALDALGRIGTPDAAKALRAASASPDTAHSDAAKFALLHCAQRLENDGNTSDAIAIYRQLLSDQSAQFLRLQCGAIIGLANSRASQAPAAMEAAMKNPNPILRATAIAQIPKLNGKSVAPFVKALTSAPPEVQALLIPALAERGEVSARPAITLLASSKNPDVSLAALQALGHIGIARQVPLLVEALNPSSPPQNAAAALASLRQMKGDEANGAIVAAMEGAPTGVKADLMDVLVSRNAKAALPGMMSFTHSMDPKLYPAAFNAVSRLGDTAQFAPLVAALASLRNRAAEEDAERSITQFASRLGEAAKPSEVVLAEFQRATTPAVRSSLLRVLGETAGPGALEAVLAATKDADDTVRDTAVRTLANWPDASAATPTLALARSIERPVYQVLLLRGYLRMLGLPNQRTPEQTLQAYAEGLQLAKRPDEKRLVLSGLAAAPVPGALKLASPMIEDAAIQSEAALAVVQIIKANPAAERELARASLQKIAAGAADANLRKEATALLGRIH
jgi:HEAT repeat protein